jgi:hypothetical protein
MTFLREFLHLVAQNFGVLVGIFMGIVACIAYARGELGGFIAYLREMLNGADGKASSKNAGYFMGAAVLCWSYAKITLAIVRRIDSMKEFDPTWVFVVLLSVIAGLVGVVVLGSSAIQAKLQAKLQGPADPPIQSIDKVENLTQEVSK